MKPVLDAGHRLIEAMMALSLAVMVLLVLGNVVLRYGFNAGIAESEDISRFLFIWMTFIGAIVGMREKTHLGMDAIIKMLPERGKIGCAILSHILMLVAVSQLMIGSWHQMELNADIVAMGAVEYPLSWMYAAGVVGALGIGALVFGNLVNILRGGVTGDGLVMVQETEGLNEVERMAQDARRDAASNEPKGFLS